jgi:hypothetical protein
MPVDDERADYVRRVIRHRVPELNETGVAAAMWPGGPPTIVIPQEMVRRMEAALVECSDRLEVVERPVGGRVSGKTTYM